MSQGQLPLVGAEDSAAYETVPDTALAAADGVQRAPMFLAKWISANDAGVTGSHQAGFHLPRSAWPLFFDRAGVKGEQLDNHITIRWEGHGETASRAIWYGEKTRSEYRLTRLGRGFPFRGEEHVGSLLVLYRGEGGYRAHVLATDDEISAFLASVGLAPGDVGELVVFEQGPDDCLVEVAAVALSTHPGFPSTSIMGDIARAAARRCFGITPSTPDVALVRWTQVEYEIFRAFESREFAAALQDGPIESVPRLIELALPFTNRRKARAGRSLEHHFAACLDAAGLSYTAQARTEGRNTMDFVFPSEEAYRDQSHPPDRLVACGAKTSAKERWRQVLEEADRVEVKHLLTLQPIAKRTVEQMVERGLQPVVPKANQQQFEKASRKHLLSVDDFLRHVRTTVDR